VGWISPNDLHEDPKQWLNVSHEFHEVLTRLMSKMFGGRLVRSVDTLRDTLLQM